MERMTHEADFGLENWEETLFFVKSDPNGAYNILDIAKYQGESEFDEILKNVALRLAAIEDILGEEYDLDHLREMMEADREGRCVVMEDLTISDLQQMLIVLDATRYGDGAETYTTGYRNGHRNGRIEILRHVLEIPEGDSSDTESALKAREQG